ncbi:MAG: DegT/DnrJ/EryC1/StrS family aminotransferase [Dehalococcoidales bacterium]|jgi:dTDP-4-amino-4,6-dideoxygalactose transaminase
MIRLAYPDLSFREVSAELEKVIDSGWLTKGPKTEELESAARKYLKVKEAVAVSSGTAALHLSLLALGVGRGDEVIVPDFTFPAAANVVEIVGAKAVLADIDRDTLNIDTGDMRRKISRKTKAVIPVHQFGYPAEMEEIMKVARKRGIFVIEDAACAFGAKYKGRMCGSIGDLGCFSFHPRKVISTGEGGLITTNDARLARSLRKFREHGMELSGSERIFSEAGFNYRISEISSVLGIAQVGKVEKIISKRLALAVKFRKAIGKIGGLRVVPESVTAGYRHIYQSFIIAVDGRKEVLGLILHLRKKGIEATISNIVIHRQLFYRKKYALKDRNYPGSVWAYEHCVALPFHTKMDGGDIVYISKILREAI